MGRNSHPTQEIKWGAFFHSSLFSFAVAFAGIFKLCHRTASKDIAITDSGVGAAVSQADVLATEQRLLVLAAATQFCTAWGLWFALSRCSCHAALWHCRWLSGHVRIFSGTGKASQLCLLSLTEARHFCQDLKIPSDPAHRSVCDVLQKWSKSKNWIVCCPSQEEKLWGR